MREEIGFIRLFALGFYPWGFFMIMNRTKLSLMKIDHNQKEISKMTNETTIINEKKSSKRLMSTRYTILVALFSALAFVAMYFEFPIVAFFPPYLKIDLSEVIVFIGGVILGPLSVVLMELIKNLLNLMIKSSTGGVGELANFSVGVALILPTIYIIKNNKSLPRAILGFVVGIISMVVIAAIGNYFIFLPLYGITNSADRIAMILPVLVPFNTIKGVIVAVLSIILHLSMRGVYRFLKVE